MLHTSTSAKCSYAYRWAAALIDLYPSAWRERYAEEMLALLEDAPPTMRTVFNLFIHLFDAYTHAKLVIERTPQLLQRKRTGELTVFGATIIYFFAWYTLQIRFDGSLIPRPIWLFPDPSLSSAYWHYMPTVFALIIPLVSWLLPLLLLLGGLPVLLSTSWQAFKAARYPTLFLTLLGIISPLVTGLLTLAPFVLQYGTGTDVQTMLWESLLIGFLGLGVDLALMFFAIQQTPSQKRVTHYALYPATVIPVVMAVGLVILVLWMAPFLIAIGRYDLPAALPFFLAQVLLFLCMGLALFFTILALIKAYKAREIEVVPEQLAREMEM